MKTRSSRSTAHYTEATGEDPGLTVFLTVQISAILSANRVPAVAAHIVSAGF